MRECIAICMPVRNAESTLARAIQSVLDQRNLKRELILVIADDNSTDGTKEILYSLAQGEPRLKILHTDMGKPAKVRNYLLHYVRSYIPECVLIGRLDADDFLYSPDTLSQVEAIYDTYDFDILFSANCQMCEGKILKWVNRPTSCLLTEEGLRKRLAQMARGNPYAELPSCNIFIRPCVDIDYPENVESAEDHWYAVLLLLHKNKFRIHIAEDLIYCVYSLNGKVTKRNISYGKYYESRQKLYEFYLEQTGKSS